MFNWTHPDYRDIQEPDGGWESNDARRTLHGKHTVPWTTRSAFRGFPDHVLPQGKFWPELDWNACLVTIVLMSFEHLTNYHRSMWQRRREMLASRFSKQRWRISIITTRCREQAIARQCSASTVWQTQCIKYVLNRTHERGDTSRKKFSVQLTYQVTLQHTQKPYRDLRTGQLLRRQPSGIKERLANRAGA